MSREIKVVDTHTGGEPTRLVVDAGLDFGAASIADRVKRLRDQEDWLRKTTVLELRGSNVMVGGLITKPMDSSCTTGVIFFNNLDYLGMCGHGTMGLMTALKHLGEIEDGEHQIETPVGRVAAELRGSRTAVRNVPSFRLHHNVVVEVPELGAVVGDVAWGGNWFFLVSNNQEPIQASKVNRLTAICHRIREALANQGITGTDGAWIDHVELFGPPENPQNDSRNFVLCPGGAYDRSPCGTGCSAKLACLAADEKLAPGESWRQESVIGSVFEASFETAESFERSVDSTNQENFPANVGHVIIPTICGDAYVSGEGVLVLHDDDPFRHGVQT